MGTPVSTNESLSLEERLPPLQLAWLATKWIESGPPPADIFTLVSTVSNILCTCHARSSNYMYDVALLLSKADIMEKNVTADLGTPALPASIDSSPTEISEHFKLQLSQHIATCPYNQSIVSMYIYANALPLLEIMPTELLLQHSDLSRLKQTLIKFAEDVKWHKMGDCYLWGIIQCIIPAWQCCTLAKGDNPWAIFSVSFKDNANAIGRPFVTQSASEMLKTLSDPLHLAILLGALALEISDKPCTLSVNSHILYTASRPEPILSVVNDCLVGTEKVTSTLGYTSNGVFFHSPDPYVVIAGFFAALAEGSRTMSYVYVNALCNSNTALLPDNPLNKYVRE